MNASNFDISSLTGESPSGGSTTPPNSSFLGCTAMQTNSTNSSLASTVNLASIQSLVDLLVELPLPAETVQQTARQQILITPSQEQQHSAHNLDAELHQQHNVSHQLTAPLSLAKRQLQDLNISWNISVPQNQGSDQYSQQHQMNSYMLSLLQQQTVFGEHVRFPPVSHFQPSGVPQPQSQQLPPQSVVPPPPIAPSTLPQGPQTRSHSHQYWNPFLSDPQSNAPSPATAPPPAALNRYPNQMCSNDNSNSSSSFSETPATPGTPNTAYSFPHQSVSRNARYSMNENGLQPKHTVSVPQSEPLKPEAKQYANIVDKEPMVVLDKLDPAETANFNLYHDNAYSSLGDRVKSHKRQRSNCSTSSVKSDHNKIVNAHFEKNQSKEYRDPSSKEFRDPSSHKRSTKAPSPVKSPSYSSTPQLSSQTSAAPPLEKLETMLDELFDMNRGKKVLKESSSDSDSDSDSGKRNKKHSRKTNGETLTENKAVLFEITLAPTTLSHFVGLTAKLKRNNSMQNMSVSKLINLLTVLTQQLTIQSASLRDKRRKSVDGVANEDDDEEEENITNSAALMAKFETCCDCCLVALYIMTSKGMSSRVYLEECIEQVIAFLNTTIQQYTAVGASPLSGSPSKKSKSPKKANHSFSSSGAGANKKILLKMYMKWSELIGCLVELLSVRAGTLTDTLVLSCTRVALGAFFLENLNASVASLTSATQTNEIQLNALRLTTSIFSQYSSHRSMILDEILHSIARLPTNKRGRVSYKVDGEDGSTAAISMFSALLLQLIQSLFTPNECKKDDKTKKSNVEMNAKEKDAEKDTKKQFAQTLRQQYDAALRTAYSFLSTFLRKSCGLTVGAVGGQADADYKVIFECLVNDLMTTLYKPNWPAAQLLTQVLIKICVTNITTTSTKAGSSAKGHGAGGGANAQLNLKLVSLDHLGTICSRFAKELSDIDKVKVDVKTSLTNLVNGDLGDNRVVKEVRKTSKNDSDQSEEESDEKSTKKSSKNKSKSKSKGKEKEDLFEDDEVMMKEIWKQLLRYCDEEKLLEEKNLFASIWLRESEREAESQQNQNQNDRGDEAPRSWQEERDLKVKRFMLLYKNASNANFGDENYHVIDSRTAELIIRYIDITFATTVKLFDSALGHVIATLSTTSNTTMRSRAMKSLSTILNNAPKHYATMLLSRSDLQRATRAALLDPSTSVREATIDLIGKFILNGQSDDLIDKYYDIITERVLDTGVSVRKRVIKILRDICITYPSYKRVPEICSKIIKRINDDGEGIRKLVTETFTSMWFKEERDKEAIKMKVRCITHVVATVLTERIGTEWLQQLLTNLFNNSAAKKTSTADDEEEEAKPTSSAQQVQQVTHASTQIVDVLIRNILCGDQSSFDQQQQQPNYKSNCVSAMTTIWLFGKVCPQLLVNHISTLQPYLSLKCTTQLDIMIMIKVVQIIEHVLPKLANPAESLLTRIEEDLTKNILQNNAQVLGVCVSCLSSLVHKHTNNKTLAQDLFRKFFNILDYLAQKPEVIIQEPKMRPKLLRSLYTCGLFAKHFEFIEEKQKLFEIFVKFVLENMPSEENYFRSADLDILLKALTGLGFMFERNPTFTLKQQTQEIYKPILNTAISLQAENQVHQEHAMCQVLKNLTNYLSDEFNNEMTSQIEWSKENLKTMTSDDGDTNSIQSSIIQLYLSDVVKCALSPLLNVRRAAVNLIHIIHNGGIVHPLQLVPYLIAMSSDDDYTIRSRADHVLNEIERKYHGFVSMKSKQGVQLSFQLHSHTGKRGYRVENVFQANNNQNPGQVSNQEQEMLITGRMSTLYSVVSCNRQSRRAFISGLLKYFDLQGTSYCLSTTYDSMNCGTSLILDENCEEAIRQFVSDNIIWLPYGVWDEPLYILHQLDLTLSLIASQTQSQFKDVLNLEGDDDDEEEMKNQSKMTESQSSNETMCSQESSVQNSLPTDSSAEFKAPRINPYNLPSTESVMELLRNVRAFYMLSWCKQLMRELYSITDVKIQDYSPNENQKVWDKAIHRRNVDVRVLDKLMMYPTTEVNLESRWDRNMLLSEYQRFKNLQLTGVDNCSKTVTQLLREPTAKSKPAIQEYSTEAHKAAYHTYCGDEDKSYSEMSREEREKLIEQIKASDCKVSLVDISSNIKSANKEPSIKMTINTSKRKKKKKEKHKKKKHKKHKFRLASSEEESGSDSSDDDSDYC